MGATELLWPPTIEIHDPKVTQGFWRVFYKKWKKTRWIGDGSKFFYQSGEKFFWIFLAWNVLKRKVKPKNSRNSTFFFKTKISPLFLKHLAVKKNDRAFHRANLPRQGICLRRQGKSFTLFALLPCTNPNFHMLETYKTSLQTITNSGVTKGVPKEDKES